MAAAAGKLRILQWLRENGCPWNCETVEFAEMEGHHDVATWAKANGCPEYPSHESWEDPLSELFKDLCGDDDDGIGPLDPLFDADDDGYF